MACAVAQADLSLRCAHMSEGKFSHVVAHLCLSQLALKVKVKDEISMESHTNQWTLVSTVFNQLQ